MITDHSATILAIEDDHLVRQAISTYLRNLGYEVLSASDGIEGLNTFRKTSPDLILTDLRLPKLDGMELLSFFRQESPDTPVIIVSGMGTIEDVIKALKLGAQDYINKPITDMALLEHAIVQALEKVKITQENKQYQSFLEEEIKKRTAELYQAQKLEAIGTMAGGIAHDFNNILGAIMGFTELALLKTEPASELEDDLLQVKKASERARDLVLQILTFSRKTARDRRPIEVTPIIKETFKLLRATMPTTVELDLNITTERTMILADPTEIHQIITNLCTNAFHALANERGKITITLNESDATTSDSKSNNSGSQMEDALQLTVKDNGSGMSDTILGSIFDPFYTTKPQGQGTGLGLSVVHGIVTDCGGTIQVSSLPGEGSTFCLQFPLVPGDLDEPARVTSLLPTGSGRILFIDDEDDLRELAERMLSYLGYSVLCCPSGLAALKVIAQDTRGFDLIISDQSMPHMPGTELAKKLQTICPQTPIILCTGYSSMIDKNKAIAMGISGFMMKPISIDALAGKIRDILATNKPTGANLVKAKKMSPQPTKAPITEAGTGAVKNE